MPYLTLRVTDQFQLLLSAEFGCQIEINWEYVWWNKVGVSHIYIGS